MASTRDLNRLDEVHSFLLTMAEQGDTSAVLATIASVLRALPVLDKPANDPYFWQQAIINLNNVADTCQREEDREHTLFGDMTTEDWESAEDFFDDDERLSDEG